MQNNWHSELRYVSLRQQSLMAEAAQHRLASVTRPHTRRIYGPVMYRLGSTLTWWGQRLQARSGELSRLPAEGLILASDSADVPNGR